MASHQKAVTSGLWEVISLTFCHLTQVWIEPGFLPVWQAVLSSPCLFRHLTSPGPIVHPRPSPQLTGRMNPLQIKQSVGTWWDLLPAAQKDTPQWQITVSAVPANKPPRNVSGISSWDTGHWGRLAGSNVYCAGTDPVDDSCPKAEPWEQRGLTLYTLASRVQKQRAKLNPHMPACDFIGYFIFPVLGDLLHVSTL
jgi:hypothetical protein